MTHDDVKKALREYLPTKAALASATAALASVLSMADGLRAVVLSGMPQGSGRVSDPVADAVCKIQQAAERISASASSYAEKLERTEQLISLADDTYGQAIIRLRWIEDVGFDFIPARINLQRSAMFEHYERAVSEISRKTNNPD